MKILFILKTILFNLMNSKRIQNAEAYAERQRERADELCQLLTERKNEATEHLEYCLAETKQENADLLHRYNVMQKRFDANRANLSKTHEKLNMTERLLKSAERELSYLDARSDEEKEADEEALMEAHHQHEIS
jgi:hypothetical protein